MHWITEDKSRLKKNSGSFVAKSLAKNTRAYFCLFSEKIIINFAKWLSTIIMHTHALPVQTDIPVGSRSGSR